MPRLLICAWCTQAKTKIQTLTASTTHGICQDCAMRIFGLELWEIPVANFPIKKVKKTRRGRTTTYGRLRPKPEDFHVR